MSTQYSFTAGEEHHQIRIDKVLSALQEDLSRARIQGLIDEGQVTLNGQVCSSASRKVEAGDALVVTVPPPVSADPTPEDIPLDVVYEDEDLLVINKPAGLVVHPGAGNQTGTLVSALLHHCAGKLSGIGGVMRPGIVHRLDKDTTGLMVVAKSDQAHKGLSDQLADRSLSRKYKAIVLGKPMPPLGRIDQPIGRHPSNRLKMDVNKRNGKEAATHYKVLESYGDEFAFVECALESGRTHQIRVHMTYIKHPLIGDPLYNPQPTAVQAALRRLEIEQSDWDYILNLPRQMLHAYALSFIHPASGETVSFESDLPEDMVSALKILKN